MFSWIQGLWSTPPAEQVAVIEQRSPSIEERLERILSRSRGLKGRSDPELAELVEDIGTIVEILESALNVLDARGVLDPRAKVLLSNLRRTRTRAQKARAA